MLCTKEDRNIRQEDKVKRKSNMNLGHSPERTAWDTFIEGRLLFVFAFTEKT